MNPAMFLVAVLSLCALPSALGLDCHHCMANVADGKSCNSTSDYTNQTCTSENATCATTTIMSNVSSAKAYILGCVEQPHDCSAYNMSQCENVTTVAANSRIGIVMCSTECCNSSLCNGALVPTMMASTESTPTESGNGTTVGSTTATAHAFRPELIGMLLFVFMAVLFGLQ